MKKVIISSFILASIFTFPIVNIEAKTQTKQTIKPSALCKDGTYSYSKTRKGTCSHHRGVKTWYK
jgi:hypothetical protein